MKKTVFTLFVLVLALALTFTFALAQGSGNPSAHVVGVSGYTFYSVEGDTTAAIDWTNFGFTPANDSWLITVQLFTKTVGTGTATAYIQCDNGGTAPYSLTTVNLTTQTGMGSNTGNAYLVVPMYCRTGGVHSWKIDWSGAGGAVAHYRVTARKN